MEFEKQIPEWVNEGDEPSETLKNNGFAAGNKPPANIFNWLFNLVFSAIKEIQTKLSKVDNTADSEKAVAFASEAGVGRKVKYPFTLRFKGGSTEGTDMWTYDGSTSRSVNITPDKIGARPTEKPNIVVNAVREQTEDNKEIYVATDNNIKELYDGLEITVIPNETNETVQPRLNINGLGDKGIRLALSFNCAATNALKTKFIQANRPITLKYHANCNLGIQGQGAWIFADRQKTSAQDLYGTVPAESGGTGCNSIDEFVSTHGICRIQKANLPEGNDLYGEDNPSSFTFDFPPKLVFISDGSYKATFIPFDNDIVNVDARNEGGETYTIKATFNGNTLQWYAFSAEEQFTLSWQNYSIIGLG